MWSIGIILPKIEDDSAAQISGPVRTPFCKPEFWKQRMSRAYSTRPITEDQIDLAFMLVEAAGREVKRAEWVSFCNRIIEWRGATGLYDDVIIAADADGHVKGLFVSEMIQSLLFGRVLDVPMFITASAGDEDGVVLELLQAAKVKAREANCGDIRIWAQGGESWIRATDDAPVASQYRGVQLRL
jgi:hypothetical protein